MFSCTDTCCVIADHQFLTAWVKEGGREKKRGCWFANGVISRLMCGSPLLKHLLHLTLEIVYTHTHTGVHTHRHHRQATWESLREPPATEYTRPVPLFYCKSRSKGRRLKGIIAAVYNELIKAALVSTWVALALGNNRGNKSKSWSDSKSFDIFIRSLLE